MVRMQDAAGAVRGHCFKAERNPHVVLNAVKPDGDGSVGCSVMADIVGERGAGTEEKVAVGQVTWRLARFGKAVVCQGQVEPDDAHLTRVIGIVKRIGSPGSVCLLANIAQCGGERSYFRGVEPVDDIPRDVET